MKATPTPPLNPPDHNLTASILEIVPGLGHLYKGHILTGLLIMFLGIPVAMVSGVVLALCTFGLGLFLPLAFWVWMIFEVYWIDDWAHRI
ncbi:MAG: hypothetical protein SFY92_06680 [Verrucomicrobiae bacterium]|nr:hypothetical protein [Verrucomicrobiae bacterium]